jgi:hypothetical protein
VNRKRVRRTKPTYNGAPNIDTRLDLVASTQTIRLPKDVVEEIYRTSVRFTELLETLEVLLDKKTMRRIKLGERQYRRKQYVAAKGPEGIRRVLSS